MSHTVERVVPKDVDVEGAGSDSTVETEIDADRERLERRAAHDEPPGTAKRGS